MKKSEIEREVALQVLGDEVYAGARLLHRGLVVVDGLRYQRAVQLALDGVSKRSTYAATKLPGNVTLRINLRTYLYATEQGSMFKVPLVSLARPRGSDLKFFDCAAAAGEIAKRCNNDVEALMRALSAIERARKQALQLLEEATRWL